MSSQRWIAVIGVLLALGAAACDNSPTGTLARPGSASFDKPIPVSNDLNTEIKSLVTSGFPKGQATSILAKWDQVLKSLANEPKTTLKGKTVPGAGGRAELVRTVSYIQLKSGEAIPPAGETQAHFVARLVLDMSLYVYGGPATPPPVLTTGSDVGFKLVSPGVADTVVTPAKQAAVAFPSTSVIEPTVVVITPDSTYYPDNCTGPLDTHLCQYPRFYHFNVFPDVKLSSPAKVQVCHVDAGGQRMPLANHDRFRVAHDKPANPADYSAGSTIVDNVEILAFTPMFVTDCLANGGTSYTTALAPNAAPLTRLAYFTNRVMHGMSVVAHALFVPRDAYAIDVGGGGFAELFSNFAVVDPDSKPDLAQSTAPDSYFHVNEIDIVAGGTIPIGSWNVTNAGSGTSGAFTSNLIVASDTALTSTFSVIDIGGASSLVPRANFSYAARDVVVPATPGTYFVGTRVVPIGADSISSDDWVSVRVIVHAPAVAGPANIALLPPFSLTTVNVVQGASLGTSGFTLANVGGSTSSPFVIRMTLAPDSGLKDVIAWQPMTGATTLNAGASVPLPASIVAVSPCVAPGGYFVGPRVETAVDADTSNDYLSRRISVLAAPAPTSQSAGSSPWTGAGPGSVTTQVNPHCANLHYNHTPSSLSTEQWTFTTTAVTTGPYTFNWTYNGLHSWFLAHEALEAFADSPAGTVVITLVANSTLNTGNGFGFSGQATLNLTAGYNWGVRPSGGHFDSSRILLGTVQIIDP
jgi:hypothetical protein